MPPSPSISPGVLPLSPILASSGRIIRWASQRPSLEPAWWVRSPGKESGKRAPSSLLAATQRHPLVVRQNIPTKGRPTPLPSRRGAWPKKGGRASPRAAPDETTFLFPDYPSLSFYISFLSTPLPYFLFLNVLLPRLSLSLRAFLRDPLFLRSASGRPLQCQLFRPQVLFLSLLRQRSFTLPSKLSMVDSFPSHACVCVYVFVRGCCLLLAAPAGVSPSVAFGRCPGLSFCLSLRRRFLFSFFRSVFSFLLRGRTVWVDSTVGFCKCLSFSRPLALILMRRYL